MNTCIYFVSAYKTFGENADYDKLNSLRINPSPEVGQP